VNFSLLGGVAGSEPGAVLARTAARRADGIESSTSPFRALVDGFADDNGSAEDAAPRTRSGSSPSREASESPKERPATVDSSKAATNSTTAAVPASDGAGTAARSSGGNAGEARAAGGDAGPAEKERHGADEDQSSVAANVLAVLTEILPAVSRGAGAAISSAAADANGTGADISDEHGQSDAMTTGLEQAMAMADEHAGGLADRIGSPTEDDAASADFDDIANQAAGLSAKELAALARARAASQSASESAAGSQAGTSTTQSANTLASFLKAASATGSSNGDSAHATSTPAAVVSHVVSFSSGTSFTGLVDRASTTNAAAAHALPESTAAQIVQTLRLVATADGGEARITLDPNQFGQLSVSVRVEHGQVVARVEADQPVVREWLQSNQNQLRHQLASQQLTLDRLEVREPSESESSARERREHANDRASEEQQRQRRQRRDGAGARFEVVA
jgi:flagellar hook-length control protein FliK